MDTEHSCYIAHDVALFSNLVQYNNSFNPGGKLMISRAKVSEVGITIAIFGVQQTLIN